MDNYEINILRRNGKWKKVKSSDLLLNTADQNHLHKKHMDGDPKFVLENNKQNDLLHNLDQVNSIINKLETLENEKTNLKNQLKVFEDKFQFKKKYACLYYLYFRHFWQPKRRHLKPWWYSI